MILQDFSVPAAWRMPSPISVLTVPIYSCHPSPKCLLNTCFQSYGWCSFVPYANSHLVQGKWGFIPLSVREYLGMPAWANINWVDPLLCGLLSLDLDCSHYFGKAGTLTEGKIRRRGPNGCCQDPWRGDIFLYLICLSVTLFLSSLRPLFLFLDRPLFLFLSLSPFLHLIYC